MELTEVVHEQKGSNQLLKFWMMQFYATRARLTERTPGWSITWKQQEFNATRAHLTR